ncbi:PcfB family protein [uncultured Dysosmobacter sp.]|uniref:PcfB family protein n=1 Tax=uncultured Dysosmobacter sp. TaxID=2591384 RepID=UPI0026372E04|nr:PcfB family protein [uncultured Dysosmobacter sp.]
MQEYVEERTVAVSVKALRLSGRVLAVALRKAAAEIKAQHEAGKRPQGRQSVKKLMNHYGTKNAMKLVGAPKDFDRIAKEFHVDYAFHKTSPGHYLLFFKADQADAVTAAFSKYSEKVLGRSQERPSILGQLRQFVQEIAARPKVQERAREAVKEER